MSLYFIKNFSIQYWKVYFILVFLLFLDSFYVYFFWSIPHVIPIAVSFFSVCFIIIKPHYFNFNIKTIIPFCLFLIAMLYDIREQNINGYIAGIIPFISLFLFFNLKINYKAKFIETLTKVLSVILFISLLAWFYVMLGGVLPNGVVSYKANGEDYFLTNYYFFIEYNFSWLKYQRFMSIFIEPGYLGSLLAFLIYLNNFELKRKEVLILFISLVMTFSLAGFAMLLISYFSFLLKKGKLSFIYLFLILSILILSLNFALQFNNGENILNLLVFDRLQTGSDGKLKGNNRTTDEMDYKFEQFLKSDSVIKGLGNKETISIDGVGYKAFIISNGLFGTSILLLAYFSGWVFNKRLFSFTICLLFLMMFSKGHSEIFWAGFLMVYASSMYLTDNWRQIYILKNDN